ncbi:hypothetical protein [Fervidicoccus fontis]|uniref:Uncharacterized protein n=1 Tax=Fervidicoccus fontis (strain DSM 19380 / JCM 18336 / VKM B-2539 / Kam940) TaxID=1163730 RepID=H9ZZ52_FERFK|nr:hypothetical protein [Fervidicoccus fontis]AFH42009.1 hypothetical protein FFONT_0013 [Fervidicoccus fontis Kam940]
MIKCPVCGHEGNEGEFKLFKEPWKFRFYDVKRLECPKCHAIFNYYSGTSPKGRKSEFVIKVKPREVKRVKK